MFSYFIYTSSTVCSLDIVSWDGINTYRASRGIFKYAYRDTLVELILHYISKPSIFEVFSERSSFQTIICSVMLSVNVIRKGSFSNTYANSKPSSICCIWGTRQRITFKPSAVQSETGQPLSGVEKGHPPFEMWRYQLLRLPELFVLTLIHAPKPNWL